MKAIVKVKGLNLRKLPGANSGIITVLNEGVSVDVIETGANGWTKVQAGNYTGYVATRYIEQIVNSLFKKSKRDIKNIVVHCTAGWQDETTAELIKGFRARGWKNNGYHIVVNADGSYDFITDLNNIANGVAGHNANSIHVSYKGGIKKENGKIVATDNRTEAQKKTLIQVLKELQQLHPGAKIKGHRDFSPDLDKDGVIEANEYIKYCPCFDAIPEYKNLNTGL